MDPLSDILSLLRPASYGFRGLDAGGDWALAFEADEGVKCYAVQSGACWLAVDGAAEPMLLSTGDFVLMPGGAPYRLCSANDVAPIDALGFLLTVSAGETAVLNGGGDMAGVGGYFGFEGMHAERLLGMLPPVVHIRAEADKAGLRWSIERLMRELRDPQPGATLIAEHLAQALLIEALRLHLAEHSNTRTGWLFALADRRMRAVIDAMHAEPGRKWTLQTLAKVAGMSRSSFAARFKATVGEPAMDYLTRWRMMVASDRLAHGGMPIAVVAPTVERIVARVIDGAFDDEDQAEYVEQLSQEVSERLDDEDFCDVLSKPISEIVSMICRDLGLSPDWARLAEEAWAQKEIASGKTGSPLAAVMAQAAETRPPTVADGPSQRTPQAASP